MSPSRGIEFEEYARPMMSPSRGIELTNLQLLHTEYVAFAKSSKIIRKKST
jgi:hypothetical protein